MSSRLRCAMLIQCVHIQKWKLWISVSLFAVAFINIWQTSMARTIRKWFVSEQTMEGTYIYISAKTSEERTIERCKWLLLNVPTTRAYFKHSIVSISSNNTAARFGHVANKLNGFVFIRCLFLVRQHIRFFIFTCYFNVNLCFFPRVVVVVVAVDASILILPYKLPRISVAIFRYAAELWLHWLD